MRVCIEDPYPSRTDLKVHLRLDSLRNWLEARGADVEIFRVADRWRAVVRAGGALGRVGWGTTPLKAMYSAGSEWDRDGRPGMDTSRLRLR